jgi:lipopolysaccharide transport system ATP-binding protein
LTGSGKQFKLYRSPADRLREIVYRKKYHKDFTALENISFEVKNGETLGIIGQNGAGKSTLLKILSGIVIPDFGAPELMELVRSHLTSKCIVGTLSNMKNYNR